MRRNNPYVEFRELIVQLGGEENAKSLELATVECVSPIAIKVNETVLREDIKQLEGVVLEKGDEVVVQMIGDDYIILGKVVEA